MSAHPPTTPAQRFEPLYPNGVPSDRLGVGGRGVRQRLATLEKLLFDAWPRVPNRRFKAAFDAGFDGEHNHELARHDKDWKAGTAHD